jgi:peptide/nickel transport system substrate-binding protein
MGGPSVAEPINRILPPQIAGGELQVESHYTSEGDKGDPGRAKQMLVDAGVSNLKLRMPYRNAGKAPSMAQAIQQDLDRAGIEVQLVPTLPNLFYTNYLFQPTANWDIAVPGWLPDWYGNAGGRSSSRYSTADLRAQLVELRLLRQREHEQADRPGTSGVQRGQAAQLWAEADQQATDDAPGYR